MEETAYAVILLSVASRITLFDAVRQQLINAVRKAEKWLVPRSSPAGEGIWVPLGKGICGSPVLNRANRLAALKAASLLPAASTIGSCLQTANAANERTIDVQINRLRRKIEEDPGNPVHLQTVRGIGYRLVIDR